MAGEGRDQPNATPYLQEELPMFHGLGLEDFPPQTVFSETDPLASCHKMHV